MVESIDNDDSDELLARYKEEISYYEKESAAWYERGRKIQRRYKDERNTRDLKNSRYNILYSNVSTLLPAVYGKNPKADIERRFKDDDDLGRVTSDILERCVDYFVQTEPFRDANRSALKDRLLPGRGTVWQRYVPHFREIVGIQEDEQDPELQPNDEPLEEVYNEEVITDFVNCMDFGHNWSRTYDEVYLCWRKVYLSKKELKKRFGDEIARLIPLDYSPKGLKDEKKESTIKKAVVYEMWDKEDKMARWVHKDVAQFLDEKEDPLKLPDFFPCPKPLFANLVNDTLIPTPDYSEYQDQAIELDELTSRISAITRAIKVAGVYDASAPGIERLMAEGLENKLIPVEQWAILSEKGGMAGVMSMLPMKDIAATLLSLYEARDKVKIDLQEITGMADIVRGANDPRETATATNTKNKFVTMRLTDLQDDMARFTKDSIKNIACIIATHFSIDTIKKICGVKLMTMQEKQQTMMQYAPPPPPPMMQGQPPAAPPQPPQPIPDNVQEMLNNPSWEEVEKLLRDEPGLCFRIDIEADSTIKIDQDAERDSRMEFLKAAGSFLTSVQQVQDPVLKPMMVKMFMFGARGFKVGRDLESTFKLTANKIDKAAANPQPQQSPEMVKVQGEIQLAQATQKAQADQMTQQQQMDMQENAQEHQFKMQEIQQKDFLSEKELQMKYDGKLREKQMDIDASKQTDTMQKNHELRLNGTSNEEEVKRVLDTIALQHHANVQNHAQTTQGLNTIANGIAALHQHLSKPKTISMQGADGQTRTATVQ
jgi:hypothetical protein